MDKCGGAKLSKVLCLLAATAVLAIFAFLPISAQSWNSVPPSGDLSASYALAQIAPEEAMYNARRRMTFYPAGKREGCQTWRFEVSALPDGQIVFQINEPADRRVILAGRWGEQAYEYVIGDPVCYFRVTIAGAR